MECTFSTECTSPLYYDNAGCQCYLWSSPLSTLEYQITVHNGKICFIWLAKKDNLLLSKYLRFFGPNWLVPDPVPQDL